MTRSKIIGAVAVVLAVTLPAAQPALGAAAATSAHPPAYAAADDPVRSPRKFDPDAGARTGVPSRPDLTARSRAAGLTAAQADALQVKADRYLAQLGEPATQVTPDVIQLKGAKLHLTVPGSAQRAPGCPYYYFCAYSGPRFTGDWIHQEECWVERYIPWTGQGSWINNQTRGTQPLLEFNSGELWWMPGAYAQQATGVGWDPVFSITACFHPSMAGTTGSAG
ncbi:hypothetical protein [Actinoplanes sp. GCM10030250]|uniref:hypothetical protein n=1 Tax=Actinoplanes sp. GCM10030250 TaxID=3273376 RepID=UPI00361B44D0